MNALYQKYIANINFNQFTKWCFTLWFYSFILKMDKRKNMMTPFWVKKTGGKNVIFVDANCKGNHLKKSIKKYNFKKDLMNLIETNNQIRMLSDHSVSSNNSFKSLWMLAVVQLQLCESWWIWLRVCCKGDVNVQRWCELGFRRKLKRTLIINYFNRSII